MQEPLKASEREMMEMIGYIEVKPVRFTERSLEAGQVRHCNNKQSLLFQKPPACLQYGRRLLHMFQNMIESNNIKRFSREARHGLCRYDVDPIHHFSIGRGFLVKLDTGYRPPVLLHDIKKESAAAPNVEERSLFITVLLNLPFFISIEVTY
jgi:hypothetical protein